MQAFLKELNDKQREAVTAPLGPVLVLAGAGSGKTRALTYRIAYLIREKLFRPDEILALTFTNKAAGEMKERVARITNHVSSITARNTKYDIRNTSLTMGTFHSVCARILRKEIQHLKNGRDQNFTIYDTDDTSRILKQIVLELQLSEQYRYQLFAYYIGSAKNQLVDVGDLHIENPYLEQMLGEVSEMYEDRLRAANAVDFDDLLTMTCQLFTPSRTLPTRGRERNKKSKFPPLDGEGKGGVLEKYQQKFKYILVDEYQDTNHTQYMILKRLAAAHKNIFVVGDDAQSIYGFRGANMQNILDFEKDYPEAKIVMLEQNYRSSKPILDVANSVIKLNRGQFEKKLWTDIKTGDKAYLFEAGNDIEEAEFVVRRITNHVSSITENEAEPVYVNEDTPILNRFMKSKWSPRIIRNTLHETPGNLKDSVILYRTHAQSRVFEEVLLSSGIPYQIVGGVKFYERREIKDAIAYLRLFLNPRDLVSLQRIINQPARGIGRVSFNTIKTGLEKYDYDYNRLLNNLDKLELTGKAQEGAREFFALFSPPREGEKKRGLTSPSPSSPARPAGGRGGENLLDLMDYLLTRSGYKENLLSDKDEGQDRWENIEELFNAAAKYEKLPNREGAREFLEEVALMTDLDTIDEARDHLTLMTLHSAKGLEWERVFLVGLEEGLLPHSRSLMTPQELSEEIRLAYVGVTRARKELFLSYARQRMSYGEIKPSMPSRILKAIPKRLLQRL